MLDDDGGPVRVAGGLRRGLPGDRWGRGFHATRRAFAESILATGLVLGGEYPGVMSPVDDLDDHWPNRAYGCHPAFVFLEPHYRDNYTWETPDGGAEEPRLTLMHLQRSTDGIEAIVTGNRLGGDLDLQLLLRCAASSGWG